MGREELLLFAGLTLMAVAVYLFVATLLKRNKDEEAMSWASGNEPVTSKSPVINFSRPLVHQFTLKYALRVPFKRYREKLRRKIMAAGLSRELNVDEFIGLQLLWGVLMPMILLICNFAFEQGLSLAVVIGASLFGFIFPHFYANSEKKNRYTSVVIDLPFFIDLLALSTEAGLDFVGSIQRIVDKAGGGVLTDEFKSVLKDIKLGSSRADALKAMSERLDIAEVTSFISVLVDADSTGASIAQVLKDQGIQMRLERFVRAEKAGARASQAILIPLMLFILPAVFIMVFGPVVLQFFYGDGVKLQ